MKPLWDHLRTQGLEEAALRSKMPMEWTMLRIVAQERDTQALAHLRDAQDGMPPAFVIVGQPCLNEYPEVP